MITIGSFEAKTHWSELLDQVSNGQEITITKRGKPVAVLIPASKTLSQQDVIAELKRLRKNTTLDGLDWKELRDEGRP